VEALKPKLSLVLLDTGYDSYEAHAHLWYHLNARPCIDTRDGAVIQEEGTEPRIRHWVNKLWRAGGDINAPLTQQCDSYTSMEELNRSGCICETRIFSTRNSQLSYKAAVSVNGYMAGLRLL